MATDFLPFATGSGANVVSLGAYTSAAMRTSGFQTGVADSSFVNRAIRQSALMTAALGQYVSDSGLDALDNGDVASLAATLGLTFASAGRNALVWSATITYPVGALVTYSGEVWQALAANTNSPPPNGNWRPVGNGLSSVSVAGASNVTLTAAQVSSRFINLLGNLTGPIQVTFPTATQRLWAVFNNTTGAFSLTVRGAVGGGIVVPQGYIALLYSDGTSIFQAGSGFTTPAGALQFAGTAAFTNNVTASAGWTWNVGALAAFNGTGVISSTGAGALVANNDPANSASTAAAMRFNRAGFYGANLGIDTDNRLKYGGGTLGAVAYDVWHTGVAPGSANASALQQRFPTGTFIQGSLTTTSIPAEGTYTVTLPTAFPTACIGAVAMVRNSTSSNAMDLWCQLVSTTATTVTFYVQRSSGGGFATPDGFVYIAWGY